MDRLIPGGIYTLSNEEHISYIFVREGRTGLIFFKLKTQYQNSKVIQNYINLTITEMINNDVNFFASCIEVVNTNEFFEKCDGFIGKVDDEVLRILKALM